MRHYRICEFENGYYQGQVLIVDEWVGLGDMLHADRKRAEQDIDKYEARERSRTPRRYHDYDPDDKAGAA